MKLTLEQKIQIYNEWKFEHRSPRFLACKYQLNHQFIEYMVHLADRYGVQKLEHNYTHYSTEFKKEAINLVLIGHQSAEGVSLDLGIANNGILARWIKEYKENGYNVVERKRGRHVVLGVLMFKSW